MNVLKPSLILGLIISLMIPAVPPFAQDTKAFNTYVDGPWGQVHVYVHEPGTGNVPTVVFLHRMTWNGSQFTNVQPLLADQGIRSISVDIPGYGCPTVQATCLMFSSTQT